MFIVYFILEKIRCVDWEKEDLYHYFRKKQ